MRVCGTLRTCHSFYARTDFCYQTADNVSYVKLLALKRAWKRVLSMKFSTRQAVGNTKAACQALLLVIAQRNMREGDDTVA